jgi:hypothetical protein
MTRQARLVCIGQVTLSLVLFVPRLLSAQQFQLQFGATYSCPDGKTYVIHRCEKGPKFEYCYYLQNPDLERMNIRSQVENQFRSCKLASASLAVPPSAAQASSGFQTDTPYQCPGGLVLTIFQCQTQSGQDYCFVRAEQNGKFLLQVPKPRSEVVQQMQPCTAGQAFNPSYLAEFPSVDRVIQGMKVVDVSESAERVIGALYQLSQIVQTLARQRSSRSLLPDEAKILNQYAAAQSAVVQYAAKAVPGQRLSLETNRYHFSPSDPRFGFEGIAVWVDFLSPGLQKQFAQIVGGNDASYQAKIAMEQQTALKTLQAEAAAAQAQAQPLPQDPGAVAMRRCMESGRSDMDCLGQGIKVGLVDLAGGNPLAGIGPSIAPGLRLSGRYSAGTFAVSFDQSSATFTCGTLIQQSLPYRVDRNGSQLQITIPIEPKPLVLSYTAQGALSGPGTIDVAGQVVVGGAVATTSAGYQEQTQTTMQRQQIDAAEAQNYIGTDAVHQNGSEYTVDSPVTTTTYTAAPVHHYSVPTAPKTERCSAALLPPTGTNIKISDALTQLLGTQGSSASNTGPGLRLAGSYSAAGGLSVEFRDDSATVECGQAAVAEAYSVSPKGSQLIVKLQNGASPFSLVLEPNGELTGSGTVNVAGRKMIRSTGDDVHNFVPQNATCNLGTLASENGGGKN